MIDEYFDFYEGGKAILQYITNVLGLDFKELWLHNLQKTIILLIKIIFLPYLKNN